jgi:hypothetical protein
MFVSRKYGSTCARWTGRPKFSMNFYRGLKDKERETVERSCIHGS